MSIITIALISLIARVPFNSEFVRLQRMIERRLFSNLFHDIGQILPRPEALAAVEEISTLIDGYWVRLGVSPDKIDPAKALEHMWKVSDRLFEGRLATHIEAHRAAKAQRTRS